MLANQPLHKALFPGISKWRVPFNDMFPSTLGWDATEGFWGYQTPQNHWGTHKTKDTGMEHIHQDVYTGSFFISKLGHPFVWIFQ